MPPTAIIHLSEFIFKDRLRILELLSFVNLLNWAFLLLSSPEIVARDTYEGFQALGPQVWAGIMIAAACLHIVPMLLNTNYNLGSRISALVVAGAVWMTIAVTFMTSHITTTADGNYLAMSLLCFASGAFLAWRKY